MKNAVRSPNSNPQTDQGADADTVARPRRSVATLRDVSDALADAARYGIPSIADWPHREVDFRILERVLDGLDHPVEAFGTLFPAVWSNLSPEMRDRIPGNARNNHMRLTARVPRAIGILRPDLDPWSALQLLADVELPTNAGVVGEVRWRALRDGLEPNEIDSGWIAAQLATIDPQRETQHRNIYQFLVRLAKQPRVRQTGLLREDLRMPREGARDGAAITAVAVTGHDLDPGAGTQPGLDRGRVPVRQQVDNPGPLQIADQCTVSLSHAPSPVVDTDNAEVTFRGLCRVSNTAQKGALRTTKMALTVFRRMKPSGRWRSYRGRGNLNQELPRKGMMKKARADARAFGGAIYRKGSTMSGMSVPAPDRASRTVLRRMSSRNRIPVSRDT